MALLYICNQLYRADKLEMFGGHGKYLMKPSALLERLFVI